MPNCNTEPITVVVKFDGEIDHITIVLMVKSPVWAPDPGNVGSGFERIDRSFSWPSVLKSLLARLCPHQDEVEKCVNILSYFVLFHFMRWQFF